MAPPITVADFKAWFTREFIYGATPDKVMDADITKALAQAATVFNEGLWEDVAETQLAFYYVAAHFLVIDIQMSGGLSATPLGKGVQSQGGGVIQSKTVGSVSVSYDLPESIMQSPILNQFMRTDFGQKYLSMLTPRLVGNVYAVAGNVDPYLGGGNPGVPFV